MRSHMRSHGWGPLRIAQGSGSPLPTNVSRSTGQDEESGPCFFQPPSPTEANSLMPQFYSLSWVPRLTNHSNPGPPNLSSPCDFWGNPTKCAFSEQFPEVCPRSHLSKHQVAAASKRQVLLILGSAQDWLLRIFGLPRTSMQISCPRGVAQSQQEAQGGGNSSSSFALPCPSVSREAKNYFAATLRCG